MRKSELGSIPYARACQSPPEAVQEKRHSRYNPLVHLGTKNTFQLDLSLPHQSRNKKNLFGITQFLHEAGVFFDTRNAKRLGLSADGINEIVVRDGRCGGSTDDGRVILYGHSAVDRLVNKPLRFENTTICVKIVHQYHILLLQQPLPVVSYVE